MGKKSLGKLLLVGSVASVIIGFVIMYHYGDYDPKYAALHDNFWDKMGHVVGGDSYNFIIMAVRGVGFILVGAILALIGCTLWIVSYIEQWLDQNKAAVPKHTLMLDDTQPIFSDRQP